MKSKHSTVISSTGETTWNNLPWRLEKTTWRCPQPCSFFPSQPLLSLAIRLEICRDRRDRRSCKIFPSCVNFSRKQRGSLSNLHRNMKFTQLFGDFTHISFKTIEIMHIHFNFNKRDYQCSHKRCFFVAKKVVLYTLLVCKIFGPKIWSCKISDKFHWFGQFAVDGWWWMREMSSNKLWRSGFRLAIIDSSDKAIAWDVCKIFENSCKPFLLAVQQLMLN